MIIVVTNLIPGLEGLICSTGVGCTNVVGPMQHGYVVWCLFNID